MRNARGGGIINTATSKSLVFPPIRLESGRMLIPTPEGEEKVQSEEEEMTFGARNATNLQMICREV